MRIQLSLPSLPFSSHSPVLPIMRWVFFFPFLCKFLFFPELLIAFKKSISFTYNWVNAKLLADSVNLLWRCLDASGFLSISSSWGIFRAFWPASGWTRCFLYLVHGCPLGILHYQPRGFFSCVGFSVSYIPCLPPSLFIPFVLVEHILQHFKRKDTWDVNLWRICTSENVFILSPSLTGC